MNELKRYKVVLVLYNINHTRVYDVVASSEDQALAIAINKDKKQYDDDCRIDYSYKTITEEDQDDTDYVVVCLNSDY